MSDSEASSEQSDNPAIASQSHFAVLATMIILLLPILYTLSIGPAAKLIEAGILSEDSLLYFYAPLIWLDENTPLAPLLEWYVELWID